MNSPIEQIRTNIEPLRQQIIHHKVYNAIKDIQDLQIFMQYHVYAVWDFMSLLKALQQALTCTSTPWFPVGSADTRFLINEIVVGEESDVDQQGVRKSHFEIYLEAMAQCGADVNGISQFINELKLSGNFATAYTAGTTPEAARRFVDFTFSTIGSNKTHVQSAVFTFGREDLIPGMFISIVNDMHQKFPDSIATFKYYLERHIEVDGDHHSHLALAMTSQLCGENEAAWKEAEAATIASLQKRIELWDGAYEEMMKRRAD